MNDRTQFWKKYYPLFLYHVQKLNKYKVRIYKIKYAYFFKFIFLFSYLEMFILNCNFIINFSQVSVTLFAIFVKFPAAVFIQRKRALLCMYSFKLVYMYKNYIRWNLNIFLTPRCGGVRKICSCTRNWHIRFYCFSLSHSLTHSTLTLVYQQ